MKLMPDWFLWSVCSFTNGAYERESGFDLKRAVVQTVGDMEYSRLVHMNPVRLIELDRARGSAHTARAALAAAGNTNYPVLFRQIFANDVVIGVGDDHIVIGVDAQMLGPVQRPRPLRIRRSRDQCLDLSR